jgi:hypothetical protein
MHKLLRLSNVAINVSHISRICIDNTKYTIHLTDIDFGGVMLLGAGGIDTTKTTVEIKKDNHRDYFKVSEYILRHSIN